jgi:DNA polymerase III gamma/tau subunit
MSKLLNDDQKLTQYLLGSLPVTEAERLDELSVTDDEVAEALRSVENDLIDAYVQDELDAEERTQFKTHYLASATRRERVAFAQDFQAHTEEMLARQMTKAHIETPAEARAETATEVAARRKRSRRVSVWRALNLSRPAWQWGAAIAALALLIVGGWLVFDNARLRQQSAQTEASAERERQAQEAQKESENKSATADAQLADERARAERERSAQEQSQHEQQRIAEQQRTAAQNSSSPGASVGSIATIILAPQVRGGGQLQSISIPANADHVVMRLRLEPNEFTAYRVTLLNETGAQTLWRSNRLTARVARDNKVLNFNLRAQLLKPQTSYVLRATNDAGEIIDDYPFRVVK